MRSRAISLLLVAIALFTIAPSLQARGRKKAASTEPGTYKEWGPDIDEIEILKSFKTADYDRIVVLPFDTSATPMPDKSDRSYDTIKSVLGRYTSTLVEGLKRELKAKLQVEQADKAPKTAKALIIRGKVDDINPGSRAGRYFGGFGAGAAGNKISGEIVDAKSGQVLARFTQSRRSAGTFKGAGGSDSEVMRDSIHAIGEDIAHLLDAF
jgi:hypothetical protein